ncbi:MAG: DUF4350 domain-containing protein [Gammaproteobacteria bacterium]|nr:DUF4350 domain-containing protein [Gammaproteobacteria bacterium]
MAGTFRVSILKRVLLWGLPIALLIGTALWYVGAYYERVEEKERVGMTGEARKNPYHAAQLLFEGLGFQVERVTDTRRLLNLPPRATLLLPAPAAFDEAQARRLAAWVEAGGHIILLADDDRLSALLGVRSVGYRAPPKDESATVGVAFGDRRLTIDLGSTGLLATEQPVIDEVSVADGEFTWYTEQSPRHRTNTDASDDDDDDDDEKNTADDTVERLDRVDQPKEGFALLGIEFGRGRVTALGSVDLFSNKFLADHDNAEFLVRLAMLHGTEPIFIAPRPEFPNLIAWLFERAWPVFIAAAVLLFAWLWRASPRFGPIEREPAPVRPGLREHLAAVGEFHAQDRDYEPLLAPLREDCRRALQLHAAREGYAGRPIALAQRLTGIDAAEIEHVLSAGASDRSAFLRIAATLAHIRDALISSRSTQQLSSPHS